MRVVKILELTCFNFAWISNFYKRYPAKKQRQFMDHNGGGDFVATFRVKILHVLLQASYFREGCLMMDHFLVQLIMDTYLLSQSRCRIFLQDTVFFSFDACLLMSLNPMSDGACFISNLDWKSNTSLGIKNRNVWMLPHFYS